MSNPVSYERKGNIGVISIDHPPVNALSRPVRRGILEAVAAARADGEAEAVVLRCEGRTFVAGADITEFGKPPLEPHFPEVLAAVEDSPKPVVAALHGTAYGGGFELALVCHYRCAAPDARVGLPEVKLGLLPGAGGTQRVPRIAGVEAALDMIARGDPVKADRALEMGLIDRIVEGEDLEAGAVEYARELLAAKAPLRRVRDMDIDPASVPEGFFDEARRRLAARARGQIAPDRIVSCLEAAVKLPMDQGLARERELFMELVKSPESAAMRHVFFAEREAGRIEGLPKDAPAREVASAAVVGAGTMGGGIAMCFANAGIPVTLLEVDEAALERGLGVVRKNYGITVKKGRLSEAAAKRRMGLIRGAVRREDIAGADLVVEAVFEDLELKKEVFAGLDRVMKPGAVLATNTSYQDVDAIARATGRPRDVLGMHFFSPANVMRLLEVVRGERTADDALATAMRVGKAVGKVCVLSRVCYGFIGNRMLAGYGREAQMLLLEGCPPERVDGAMERFGMAMGPLAMGDLAGLDVGYKARKSRPGPPGDPRPHRVGDALVEMGRLGQKTGAGFYKYDPRTRRRMPDPEVAALIAGEAEKLGVARREVPDEEIVARCVYPLVNEGARILEEGVAQRPGDIDVVYVFGYAFPAAKGGPMRHADQVGLGKVLDGVRRFGERHGGEHWRPAPLLERLAAEGGSFGRWRRE